MELGRYLTRARQCGLGRQPVGCYGLARLPLRAQLRRRPRHALRCGENLQPSATGEVLCEGTDMTDTTSTTQEDGQPRLGLALSGGGFRAAFFHLGVLARMADLDLLRQVEVLSTVSGGSVIGAMYYLKVRQLLQRCRDKDVQSECYIRIVSDLEREFYDGVRRNLRMRTFASPIKNWRMYSRRYSRSDRIAELYRQYLFKPLVEDCLLPSIPLRKTIIQPAGEPCGFKPFAITNGCTANDRRRHKVPVLLLNTTTLNTGHNFRFTSTWMGEMPTKGAKQEIDQNTRLRRAYFSGDCLPTKYEELPLGIAVAASTAVPGVFHPLALTDLYEGWTPQLVDGGVHDNQGIEGLLDNGCTHLIVSDACGQMEDDPDPSTRAISVLSRSNSAMMDRIREEMYETAAPPKGTTNKELVFFHLRQDLGRPELTWIGGTKKKENEQEVDGTITYGVDKNVQILLSNVRTDLDSFTEVEAKALMADGYLIAESQINQCLAQKFDRSCQGTLQNGENSWRFLRVKPYLREPSRDRSFNRQLEIAGANAFKVFKRFRWLKYTAVGFGLILLGTPFCYMICVIPNHSVGFADWLYERLHTYRSLGLTLLGTLLYGVLFLLPRSPRWVALALLRDLPLRLVLQPAAAIIAAAAAWLHILVFDRLFLWQGRVDRLKCKDG